jgi:hypothetical protein
MSRTGRTICLAIALAALGADSSREPRARIALDPPTPQLAAGETRLVAVAVRGVPEPGVAAFQVTIEFDPAAVRIEDPNAAVASGGVPAFAPLGGSPLCAPARGLPQCPDPEWMLVGSGRQPFGTSRSDVAAGRVTIGFATAGDAATPTGDGALALVRIVATGGGRTGLRITDAILADASDPPRRFEVEPRLRPAPPEGQRPRRQR